MPVDADCEHGRAILRYMRQISEEAGLRTRYRHSGRQIGEYRLVDAVAAPDPTLREQEILRDS